VLPPGVREHLLGDHLCNSGFGLVILLSTECARNRMYVKSSAWEQFEMSLRSPVRR
jgi:hypothetical protein